MMNCCIRDAILFCARDAIYNREARRRFSANGFFLHEFGSCCLENLSFFATFYCFLCDDPKEATMFDLKFRFSEKAMKNLQHNLKFTKYILVESKGRFCQFFVALLENLTFVRYFWKNLYTIPGKTFKK